MAKKNNMSVDSKGLNSEQTHRVLEDLQTIAMVGAIHTYSIEKKDEKLITDTNNLLKQVTEALGRDIMGMLNGSAEK